VVLGLEREEGDGTRPWLGQWEEGRPEVILDESWGGDRGMFGEESVSGCLPILQPIWQEKRCFQQNWGWKKGH